MHTELVPLTKLLLPVDGDQNIKRPAVLAGRIAALLAGRVELITLLHVMAGRYLSQHMVNIDFRAEQILESDQFRRLRQQYIDEGITPILDEMEREILAQESNVPVERLILDGDPVDEILRVAREGNYSSIIMERRGLSPAKELLMGSVTSGILHSNAQATIYVVGTTGVHGIRCPGRRYVIAVDGSKSSIAAVEEAAILAGACVPELEEIVIIRVVKPSRLASLLSEGSVKDDVGEEGMERAVSILKGAGIPTEKIIQKTAYGEPAEVITTEARSKNTDIIFMGRNGRSALKDILMGSVSRGVVYRCHEITIALASATEEG